MTVPNLLGGEPAATGAAAIAGRASVSADELTILAVDDEHTAARGSGAAAARLAERRAKWNARSTATRRWSRRRRSRYDAIFLDVRMPDLDGLELARVLRRFATPPQIVFVSAYDSAAVDAFELHALDYLRKPVGRRRVEEAIERVAAAIEATGRRLGPGPRQPTGGGAGERRDDRSGQPPRRARPG